MPPKTWSTSVRPPAPGPRETFRPAAGASLVDHDPAGRARPRRDVDWSDPGPWRASDLMTREILLSRALRGLWMASQPILCTTRRQVVAYEALVRTDERRIPDPATLLGTAEILHRVHELGRCIRAAVATSVPDAPRDALLYVNLHASDLGDEQLFSPDAPLSAHAPRVVLEITERAALHDPDGVPDRVRALRALGYRIAIDDLGAGYATLSWFAALEPDVAKLDLSLVRGVDQDRVKRKLVRAMVELCKDLGVLVVAEGVETAAERDAVVDLGCDLVQGYWFARPDRGFPRARW